MTAPTTPTTRTWGNWKTWLVGLAATAGGVFGLQKMGSASNTEPKRFEVVAEDMPQIGMIRLMLTYALPGGPDSVLTRVTTSTGPGQAHRLAATALRDSFFVARPTVGTTATGVGCAESKRRGLSSGEVCRAWSKTIADVPPPPPILDSIKADTTIAGLDLKPDAPLTVLAGGQVQFCAFLIFRGGQVAMRTQDEPGCAGHYGAFPASLRVLTVDQQRVANRQCIRWTTRDGTITAEDCGVGL